MMDRAMRGSSGAPLSSMGTLPGNVIRFFPFGSCSKKYPPTSNDISRCLSEMEFTSQTGSDGRDVPVSTLGSVLPVIRAGYFGGDAQGARSTSRSLDGA